MARSAKRSTSQGKIQRAAHLVEERETKKSVTLPQPNSAQLFSELAPSDEQIRMLAYCKWEVAGAPLSDGLEFWLEAERELTGR